MAGRQKYSYQGEEYTRNALSAATGVPSATLYRRLAKGESLEEIVKTHKSKKGRISGYDVSDVMLDTDPDLYRDCTPEQIAEMKKYL